MTLSGTSLWNSMNLTKFETKLEIGTTTDSITLKSTEQSPTLGWKVGVPLARHTHCFERFLVTK